MNDKRKLRDYLVIEAIARHTRTMMFGWIEKQEDIIDFFKEFSDSFIAIETEHKGEIEKRRDHHIDLYETACRVYDHLEKASREIKDWNKRS